MANYKLAIYKKNQYEEIKLNIGKKINEVDEFTVEFTDENQLKLYLIEKELILSSDINTKIYIIYKNNNEIKKLPVIYKDRKRYLDYNYVKNKLKSLKTDIKFLEKLANHYSTGSAKFNPQLLNVNDIRLYLSDARNNSLSLDSEAMLDKALDDLIFKAISSIDKKTGEYNFKYRGLRDLGLFISRYTENKKLNDIKTNIRNDVSYQGEQINFFDNYNFDDIDDYEEPYFPPNSEEEKMYDDYMDYLLSLDEFDDAKKYKK